MQPLSPTDPSTAGEFTLRARLGAGGMGRVYLGHSPAGRAVAVKVVHPELARDEEFLARFRNEVAAARVVSGMYTAPVVASGLDDDPPWLATVYVPGPALDAVVSTHGPLPEPALWRLAAGLSEALQAVHASGLVHRDLKPSNVLLAADGPHVIDFGISRAMDGARLTATGMVVGTPGYMSPEQAEGQQAGPSSDVFSLACVVAYAATGKQPFGTGSAASVLYRVVAGQPDLDGVPRSLREVLEACLRKDASQRPLLPAVAAAFSRGAGVPGDGTQSPASFWPRAVADIIRDSSGPAPGAPAPSPPRPSRPAGPGPGMPASPVPASPVPGPAHSPPAGMPGSPVPGAVPSYAQPQGGPYAGQPGAYTGQPGAYAPPPVLPSSYHPPSYAQATPGRPAASQPGPVPSAGPGIGQPPMAVPHGFRPARRKPARAELPSSVVAALRVMYAGLAVTILAFLAGIVEMVHLDHIATTALDSRTQSAAMSSFGVLALFSFCGGIVGFVLWPLCAWAVRNGRQWGATVGTVFFGLDLVCVPFILAGARDAPTVRILSLLAWGLGLAAVILAWKPASRAFYRAFR